MNLKLAEKLAEMDRRREALAATVQHYKKKNDDLEAAQRARGDDKFGREALERLYARLERREPHG